MYIMYEQSHYEGMNDLEGYSMALEMELANSYITHSRRPQSIYGPLDRGMI